MLGWRDGPMALLVFGTLAFGLGWVFLVSALLQSRRAKAIHRVLASTLPTPIASARPGRVVVIEGTVVPSEQGLVVTRVSGRHAVYHHVVIRRVSSKVDPCHTAHERRDFWIQDASGACARIAAPLPAVIVRHTRFTPSGRSPPGLMTPHPPECLGYQPFSPSVLSWLGQITTVDERLMAVEQVIAPGERVQVLGLARRAPDGTLFLTPAPKLDLLVSTLSAHELLETHRDEHGLALGFVLTGIALCLIGPALAVWGLLTW